MQTPGPARHGRHLGLGLLWASLLAPALAFGAGVIEEALGVRFGMSAEQVLQSVHSSARQELLSDEVMGRDRVIRAGRAQDGEQSHVLYVLPDSRDRLALVIETFPGRTDAEPIIADLRKRFGPPMPEGMAEKLLERMRAGLPEGVRKLTLWTGTGDDANRLVRLLHFDDHLAVEHLDPDLMAGR